MEKVARKKVIVFTPNGFVPQRPYDGNPFQEHLSGWSVDEIHELTGIDPWFLAQLLELIAAERWYAGLGSIDAGAVSCSGRSAAAIRCR